MLFYPQLSSGAITQYPVTRHNIRRTVVNLLPDGTCIRTADDGAATVSWELDYSHLVLDELEGIQRLFAAACGEWQTFTFTDPTDNLLQWSEDLTQAVWKSDPLLSASSGVQDPNGGTAAVTLTNASQINQQIVQTLQIPAGNQYCLSVYLRCDQATAVNLVASNADSQAQSTILAAPGWQRAKCSFQMTSQASQLTVGLSLPAGAGISVFGVQLEAQLAAGDYKKTRDRAGVYSKTRFNASTLEAVATGPNQYSCTVNLVSLVAG